MYDSAGSLQLAHGLYIAVKRYLGKCIVQKIEYHDIGCVIVFDDETGDNKILTLPNLCKSDRLLTDKILHEYKMIDEYKEMYVTTLRSFGEEHTKDFTVM